MRGLDRSLAVSGKPGTVIVFSLGMGENLEYSSVPMRTSDLLAASINGIQERYGQKYASPELYLGTMVQASEEAPQEMGLVRRGSRLRHCWCTATSRLLKATGPGSTKCLLAGWRPRSWGSPRLRFNPDAGCISKAESGSSAERLQLPGQRMSRRSGVVSTTSSRHSNGRISVSSLSRLGPEVEFQDVDLFCKERLDLELQAIRQTDYFAALRKDYAPVRLLSWLVVALVSGAGVFIGLNTMYGAVVGPDP